ncbi:MAG: hypothetical protein Q8R47_06215 [Nanoarchaeota archaeon]|nr:hypothetical protein [Nanoarchaeota archaeon]
MAGKVEMTAKEIELVEKLSQVTKEKNLFRTEEKLFKVLRRD